MYQQKHSGRSARHACQKRRFFLKSKSSDASPMAASSTGESLFNLIAPFLSILCNFRAFRISQRQVPDKISTQLSENKHWSLSFTSSYIKIKFANKVENSVPERNRASNIPQYTRHNCGFHSSLAGVKLFKAQKLFVSNCFSVFKNILRCN